MSLSELLRKYELKPRKGLGQNFLTDPVHLAKIVEAAELSAADTVLEIGPGPGMLTRLLSQTAGQVIAVEVDDGMVNLLKSEYGHLPNLAVIQADILQTDVGALLQTVAANRPISPDSSQPSASHNYKVVANLPYYITSAVLRRLLESSPQPSRIVVTVQKEVAQRIMAGPGQMSLLAVSVQFYGRPALVHHIPAGAFFPRPNVDSAVIRIDTYDHPPVPVADIDHFFRVVKAGFSQKRKQLKNTLSAGLQLSRQDIVSAMNQANIEPRRRAQSLSLAEWGQLVQALKSLS